MVWQSHSGAGSWGRFGRVGARDRHCCESAPALWPQHDPSVGPGTDHGAGRHVEQFTWRWYGHLDAVRFTAAWQSVIDRESVMRSALTDGPTPHLAVHHHARATIARYRSGQVDWNELCERERLHGPDPRRPGPVRVALLAPEPEASPSANPTRALVTFHHALLDAWSASRLLEKVCRAYLAGGVLPGGERRPDLCDWTHWLQRQDLGPARDYWMRAIPQGESALLPATPGPPTGERGYGRAEVPMADALSEAAARWAVPESSVLQTVWALLLHRAAADRQGMRVGFGVLVSGRGIALDAAQSVLGPLRNCLPMVARVDPEDRLDRLLATIRDQALEMSAYEWVALRQIGAWTDRPRAELLDSVVAVEHESRPLVGLHADLADIGVRVEWERLSEADPDHPVILSARRDVHDELDLAVLHDRSRLSDADAGLLAHQVAGLLRGLAGAQGTATVAAVLSVLEGTEPPRVAGVPPVSAG